VLRPCAPRDSVVFLAEVGQEMPTGLAEVGTATEEELAMGQAEENDEADQLASLAQHIGSMPLFVAFWGVAWAGLVVFLMVKALQRRNAGSEEQRTRLIVS